MYQPQPIQQYLDVNRYETERHGWNFDRQRGAVIVEHNAGFFSCCCLRLFRIIQTYVLDDYNPPVVVDSSGQFDRYKPPGASDRDVTFDYFRHYDDFPESDLRSFNDNLEKRQFHSYWDDQYYPYKLVLDLPGVSPFIRRYFSPSYEVQGLISDLERKYCLDGQYDNICALAYRGTDKRNELSICEASDFVSRAKERQTLYHDTKFIVQSDETEFITTALNELGQDNCIVFWDEIRHMPRNRSGNVDMINREQNPYFSKYFLSITIIMSRCRWVQCVSGNCSLWIAYYRGHLCGVEQWCAGDWIAPDT